MCSFWYSTFPFVPDRYAAHHPKVPRDNMKLWHCDRSVKSSALLLPLTMVISGCWNVL
jgi:hypothetical protein